MSAELYGGQDPVVLGPPMDVAIFAGLVADVPFEVARMVNQPSSTWSATVRHGNGSWAAIVNTREDAERAARVLAAQALALRAARQRVAELEAEGVRCANELTAGAKATRDEVEKVDDEPPF